MTTKQTAPGRGATADRFLVYSALGYAIGMVVHGVDHAIRGVTGDDAQAAWPGTVQVVAAILTLAVSAGALALVFRGHRLAPVAAVLIGFGSATVFVLVHLLPRWIALSDSFVAAQAGARVTTYSWATAALEIATALVFGVAGVRAFGR